METAEEIKQMVQCQEAFVIQCSERKGHQLEQVPNAGTADDLQKKLELDDDTILHQLSRDLIQRRMNIVNSLQKACLELDDLQKTVYTELLPWRRAQQLIGSSFQNTDLLDQIAQWYEALVDIIWENRQQIKQVENLASRLALIVPGNAMEKLRHIKKQAYNTLITLITSTFIIEKQPPRVVKMNTRFTATVRLLVGSKLSIYMTPPQVKVMIMSEKQAREMLTKVEFEPGEGSGEILNNIGTMEYHEATKKLSVNFRNMQLKTIERAKEEGTESVVDEKFTLLFQSEFKVGGDLIFHVWAISLPVVVIDNSNQEPRAWATIIWDNSSTQSGCDSFRLPDEVCWKDMADVLCSNFMELTNRGLTDYHLKYLACKVLRTSQFTDKCNMVSWSRFCKESLPGCSFTFWEWFYATMIFTREQLHNLWTDGLIMGFIGTHQAEELLSKTCTGTFLIRFSDFLLGGVTIAWVDDSQIREGLFMCMSFTGRDLKSRSLADQINDLKHLLHLYPCISKDSVFRKYYTQEETLYKSFVKSLMVSQMPALEEGYGYNSYPGTPQSSILQSPEPGYHDQHSSDMQRYEEYHMNSELSNREIAPKSSKPVDFSSTMYELVSVPRKTGKVGTSSLFR